MSTNEERCQNLLINYGFDNDIDEFLNEKELPKEPKKKGAKPSFETIELQKLQTKREAEFRSWLIENRPKHSVMTAIETTTATGVPDIFACYTGKSFWLECKSLISPALTYLRGTQYIYFKKLIEAGGKGKILTQCILRQTQKAATIQIYNAEDIVCHPIDFFKASGQRLYFPKTIKPRHIWHYNQQANYTTEYLYQLIFLDNEDIIW